MLSCKVINSKILSCCKVNKKYYIRIKYSSKVNKKYKKKKVVSDKL